jgi:hypothetical protein
MGFLLLRPSTFLMDTYVVSVQWKKDFIHKRSKNYSVRNKYNEKYARPIWRKP